MRTLIGSLVLVVGLIGLGGWSYVDHAAQIEARISADVQQIVENADHGLTATVAGRDVTVAGRVGDALDREALASALTAVKGLRALDMEGVDILPVASPYTMIVVKNGSEWTAEGVVPDTRTRAAFEALTGADFSKPRLAAGAPEIWVDMGTRALSALGALENGTVDLFDTQLTFIATVDTPADRDAILSALGAEGRFSVVDQISVRDDGTPMRISLALDNGVMTGGAKLPRGMDSQMIVDRFGDVPGLAVSQSVLEGPTSDWPDVAAQSMDALALLIVGQLDVEGQSVSVTGEGSPDGIGAADQLLAALPSSYDVETDLTVFGADRPLVLTMDWNGTDAKASGTYPADFTPRGPQGSAVADTGEVMFLPDTDGAFTANADAGVAALGLLQSGILTATASEVSLAGTATSPQVGEAIATVLENAAPDASITQTLTFLDDGSPAAWQVTYDAASGARVAGRLPLGLGAGDIGDALGVPVASFNTTTALEDESTGRFADVFPALAPYLPEVETLTFDQAADGASFDLVVSPGVDIDLIALDLAERLPSDVAFSIGPLDPIPAEGTSRTNAATGLMEVFIDGFWIPDLNFSTTIEGCAAETMRVLREGGVNFLSGSSRLDAASLRVINTLAAIAVPCVEADLELEVAGHTDASGDAAQNQILSQDRAQTVRAALIARGVPARAITAIGFGGSQPVADNETAEGRALNRRTDITWFERGALRDP